jgi:hypothetical protein
MIYCKDYTIYSILRKAILITVLSWTIATIFINQTLAQTCAVGSAKSTAEYALVATGGSSNAAKAVGAILSAGTVLNASNAATVSITPSLPLVLDFGIFVSSNVPIVVSASRFGAVNATAIVEYSLDNVTYASLGATMSITTTNSNYFNYISPAAGLRYLRVTNTTATSVNFFVDGVMALQNFGLTATGGSANPTNAQLTILSAGTALTIANAASVNAGASLDIDLGRFAAIGSTVTIAASRNGATNATASVSYSVNGTTYTAFGTGLSLVAANSTYTNFTVPASGLRFIRITGLTNNSFVDGLSYNFYCPFALLNANNEQQLVQNPGTAVGNILDNDQVPNGTFSLSIVSNVSNGTLVLNTTTGVYTYTPNSGYQGLDQFTYKLCDAGPDGNILTTADNYCDNAVVTFRSMFNCNNTIFYVPIPENEARDFLEDINTSNNDPTQVYIGLSVLSEGLIVFDQWEDGYEVDITKPLQTTSKIWGDGDLSNGIAPGYPTDLIPAGSTIILSNSLTSGHNNTTTYNPNAAGADLTLQNTIDYDGKDKFFIAGEASMTKYAWGSNGITSICGGAVPATSAWGTSYKLPVGQNTANGGAQFEITNFSIIAQTNNTTVTIDRDANGTTDISVVLNQGETYYVDSRQGATIIATNQGATINSNNPVLVMIMTGDYNSLPYAGRVMALTPTSFLATSYYTPGIPGMAVRVFMYNPNASAITVTRTTAGGATVNTVVNANSSNFIDMNNSGFGFQFSSTLPFNILATVDFNGGTSDWGFTPVPATNMSPIALLSFAEGSDPTDPAYGINNYVQVLITPTCNTFLYIDVNGDGIADKVSFNSDIDVLDAAVTIGGISYNETTSNNGILLNQFQTITIGGQSGNLNGAKIWTKTAANNAGTLGCNIAVVYGQNDGSAGTTPNLDAGSTVPKTSIPLDVAVIKPTVVCPNNTSSTITTTIANGTAPYYGLLVNKTSGQSYYVTYATAVKVFSASNAGDYVLKINDNNCLSFEFSFTIGVSSNCGTNAINDQNNTWINMPISGNVMTNDFDQEGNIQTFSAFLNAALSGTITTGATIAGTSKSGANVASAGVLTFGTNGSYNFAPASTFTGSVTVPYKLCDNGTPNFCDTGYLVITVDSFPIKNSAIASNDENISYGNVVSSNVLFNDVDPQGNILSVSSFNYDNDGLDSTPNVSGTLGTAVTIGGKTYEGKPATNAGTFVLNANGTYTFTPASDFFGSVDINYTACDNATPSACATTKLHIDVQYDFNSLLNDKPLAGDDVGFGFINSTISGIFANNDGDVNGNPLSLNGITINTAGPQTPIGTAVATAQGGTIQYYANGTYLYTPAANYFGPDQAIYTTCDVTAVSPQPLCANATIDLIIAPGITIAGNVWNDVNGNALLISETNIAPAANTLFVNLLNSSGNVVATTAVSTTGTYSFTNVTPNQSYTLQLSTNQGTINSPAPATAMPSGWVTTGENKNGTIDGGIPGLIDLSTYGLLNVTNYNFGIEQLPTPTSIVGAPQYNPGGTSSLTVAANNFGGIDYSGGTISSIIITSFPSNATTITINGTTYTSLSFPVAGVTVPTNTSGQPTQAISVDPINGIVNVAIPYKVVDNAGKPSTIAANATVPFIGQVVGTIYDDGNGTTDNSVLGIGIGGPTSSVSITQLYVNLVDQSTGLVVQTAAVNADGTYTLPVSYNANYDVQLTINQGTIGSVPPANALPSNWANASEHIGLGGGADASVNGVLTVNYTAGLNMTEKVDFGIDFLPDAASASYFINYPLLGFVETINTANQMGILTGTDLEDGVISANGTIKITDLGLMNGNILFYDADNDNIVDAGEAVTVGTVINNYVPGKLKVSFMGPGSMSFQFSFAIADATGKYDQSPATFNAYWTNALPITLIDFNAVKNNLSAIITWATLNEQNSDKFELETSIDGVKWQTIATINAAGNSTEKIDYQFEHINPAKGYNYYRLKQFDLSNEISFSEVKSVIFDGASADLINIYPNPASNLVNIELNTNGINTVTSILLMNNIGQTVLIKEVSIDESKIIIELNHLSKGIYSVFFNGTVNTTKKLVVN